MYLLSQNQELKDAITENKLKENRLEFERQNGVERIKDKELDKMIWQTRHEVA